MNAASHFARGDSKRSDPFRSRRQRGQQNISLEATASAASHFARGDSERSELFLLEASASIASHFATQRAQRYIALEATASAAILTLSHLARNDSERSEPFLLEASASLASHFARGDSGCNKIAPRAMYIQSATLPGELLCLRRQQARAISLEMQRATSLDATGSAARHFARGGSERSETIR